MTSDYQNEDFQHGFQSGVQNINKEQYEGFLTHQVSFEWLQKQLDEKKVSFQELLTRIDTTQATRKTAFAAFTEHQAAAAATERQLHHLDNEREEVRERIAIIEENKTSHRTPYALLAGILYLLAGVAFVAGDLIISHEIVAYALNIRNEVEAWAFAIGLASLSVLLKPAYERLVENPYLRNRTPQAKKVYGIFQTLLLVFAIGTMGVLGWFRYEAYKTDRLKENINRQIKALQLEAQPIDVTQPVDNQALMQKIDGMMKASDQLTLDLVTSPWTLFSFVLSGILFAIAGAICLGIAFPIMHAYWYRWLQAGPALKRLRKKLAAVQAEYEAVEQRIFEHRKLATVQQNELDMLPQLANLEEERTNLLNEIKVLEDKCRKADEDRRIYIHSDGYEFGQSDDLTDEERIALRNSRLQELQLARADQPDRQPRVYRSNGLRPHQALRRAITNGFNEN